MPVCASSMVFADAILRVVIQLVRRVGREARRQRERMVNKIGRALSDLASNRWRNLESAEPQRQTRFFAPPRVVFYTALSRGHLSFGGPLTLLVQHVIVASISRRARALWLRASVTSLPRPSTMASRISTTKVKTKQPESKILRNENTNLC